MGSVTPLRKTAPERELQRCRSDISGTRLATLGRPNIGWRAPIACAAAAVTYRQLDYWTRTELVTPSVRPANDSGSQRLYSVGDIVCLAIVKQLLDLGVSLQALREYLGGWLADGAVGALTVADRRVTLTVDTDAIITDVVNTLAGLPCEESLSWR